MFSDQLHIDNYDLLILNIIFKNSHRSNRCRKCYVTCIPFLSWMCRLILVKMLSLYFRIYSEIIDCLILLKCLRAGLSKRIASLFARKPIYACSKFDYVKNHEFIKCWRYLRILVQWYVIRNICLFIYIYLFNRKIRITLWKSWHKSA